MTLRISDSARQRLTGLIRETDLEVPVVTVLRARYLTGADTGWSVALIEQSKLKSPAERNGNLLVHIDEQWADPLDESLLDVEEERFIVIVPMQEK